MQLHGLYVLKDLLPLPNAGKFHARDTKSSGTQITVKVIRPYSHMINRHILLKVIIDPRSIHALLIEVVSRNE
jgi:hypothetical protein